MSLSRLTLVHDKLILGVDLSKQLVNGRVYVVSNIMDTIILTDIGESALRKYAEEHEGRENRTFSQIMHDGNYLLTIDEWLKQKKRNER